MFWEMKLPDSKVKVVVIFFQKNLLLYFERQLFKRPLYILGVNFPSSNIKKFTLKNIYIYIYFGKLHF